ncbi:DUF3010 family protein [Pseudomonas otitidis]|uniref:DUF3010 family protein n=1 Tax=Metapseudomonas otitidis TaxID=319939 RepID=A0A7X3KV80_9GAMM|nr:DUF3010 family protein [Pseudomonas otitidis]MWK58356.1 DUF3010 family protein [Pseudomonas otitidis]
MNKICGVELKGSEAIIALLEKKDTGYAHLNIEPRKIKLGDDESSAHVKSFFETFQNLIRQHEIDLIIIKKRAHKGQMAGGAISFKMESLIQLNGIAEVRFETGQGIAAAEKKSPFELPESLNKYQEDAFKSAALYIRKHGI